MASYRIAAIPGDGIGNEVVPEGIRVMEAVGASHGIDFTWKNYPWSCEHYKKTGTMMPDDGLEQIRDSDAIFLGAVGFPGVADHVSLWGLLIPIRREFHQYVNLRPVRLKVLFLCVDITVVGNGFLSFKNMLITKVMLFIKD